MKLKTWTWYLGDARRARRAGITGRLAEVCDGQHTYLRSTAARTIEGVRREYLATADYGDYPVPDLVVRIVPAGED